MVFDWTQAFSEVAEAPFLAEEHRRKEGEILRVRSLPDLKRFLDWVHIKECLLKPYFEHGNYPVVDFRELLPSFEADAFEYKDLPGFSMVALARPLKYFQEIFQYDILHCLLDYTDETYRDQCPLETSIFGQNTRAFCARLSKAAQDRFRREFSETDVTSLENYAGLLPTILDMDRAHVMSLDSQNDFYLSGVYCSFPSYLDTELKRFGLNIKKFVVGDDRRYERHRNFVYQFLMELYGFPIVSERRTSSALFARRLFRMGERFLVRVLGQTDRTITTLSSHPEARFYPRVEKIALVAVDKNQTEAIRALAENGYFVDPDRRVVITRVVYRQHKYDPNNVRQDRALSVASQEVIHPVTGKTYYRLNLVKDTYSLFLRLNDIVRGEYNGRIVYKRNEIVENTDTHEKKLKFLYAWLAKHQRRIIGYSDEFYSNVVKVLDNYLLSADHYDDFSAMRELYQEVWSKYNYIQQARKVKILEDLVDRNYKGENLSYQRMLALFTEILNDLKFEIVNYFDQLVERVLSLGDMILNERYLLRNYIRKKDTELSAYGLSVKKTYGRLVALLDEFRSIRKAKKDKGIVVPLVAQS
ncbi:MAG: hypothetical protein ACP59X_13090 [Solidesulfovibrio sp. DCME]|uniref:hypothetical protein n=1 Tax=Solidesulfovibrio sp. DCME TaxID=3447380 RepID=UPI003D12F986